MPDTDLVREKVEQAKRACAATDTDLWLTFCRETGDSPDASLPLILGFDVVWATMVAIPREGPSTVVLGRHDAPTARELGVHEVVAYDESLREPFYDLLDDTDPDSIAVNFDTDDPVADGLSHGMYLSLVDLLDGTGYEDSLVGAGDVIRRVRGRKSTTERERMARAAETSENLLAEAVDRWTPDTTEREFAAFVHDRMREAGLDSAWAWEYCPTVHMGGASEVGHTTAGDLRLPAGEVLHVDFGVKVAGYAADIQRCFYRPSDEHPTPPRALREAFDAVRGAVDCAFDTLEPGSLGHEVDTAARSELTDRGWSEYAHATGHGVGRFAHDGGRFSARGGTATATRPTTRFARARYTRSNSASRRSGAISDRRTWRSSLPREPSGSTRHRRTCEPSSSVATEGRKAGALTGLRAIGRV